MAKRSVSLPFDIVKLTSTNTNLEIIILQLDRAGPTRVLTRHVPPRSVVPIPEDRAYGCPIDAETGEIWDQIVSVEADAEVLVQEPRDGTIKVVPPIAEN